jgi:hypothetical protein
MDRLQSLVERIINTTPMSRRELWALTGAVKLGGMVYNIGSTHWDDIANCDRESVQDGGRNVLDDIAVEVYLTERHGLGL